MTDSVYTDSVYTLAWDCLMTAKPQEKVKKTLRFHQRLLAGDLNYDAISSDPQRVEIPGRPEQPELVDGKKVPRRKLGSKEGRVALLHAIAHIEFNAINLALDAVYRFRDMPQAFVDDWVKIAKEEAQHYNLLVERLHALGSYYGAMPAHNGLWDMALNTDHDVLVRMALVPRVLEARGLDVAPGMSRKLRQLGDSESAEILDLIYREEIGHVKIGNHWFIDLCRERDIQPQETFISLLKQYTHGFLRGPFNQHGRQLAGFSEQELKALEELDAAK